MAKKIKTNALRLLDQAKIDYEIKEYEYDEDHLSGEHIVAQVEIPAKDIFKTLVLKGNHEKYDDQVFKLYIHCQNKSVAMIHMKDLLATTGYIRGGCSPVGMKKKFDTYFDCSINECDKIALSAGKRGYQMIVEAKQLLAYLDAVVGDVIRR